MTLKRKIALNLSIAFSILFGLVMIVIYILFNGFRKEEFKERFRKRLDFTITFIEKSKNFEEEAPLFFDENSDNVLLNEQILIFNAKRELIYSTIKDRKVSWDSRILDDLEKKKIIYDESASPEIYAALREINNTKYYILTTAVDVNGNSKLLFLKYLLIFSYAVSLLILWLFCYNIVGKFLKPLEELNAQVSEITAHKLTNQIPEQNYKDEISVLTRSFNTMIKRLNDVFQSQRDFTASASHEIRTPLTRMSFQLENLIKLQKHDDEVLASLKRMHTDVHQLSDLTNSLLLLTKFDKENIRSIFELVRIDEVVFDAFANVESNFPELQMDFEILDSIDDLEILELRGVKSLLEIVFINLLKNAAIYSEDQKASVDILQIDNHLVVDVCSKGKTLSEEEQSRLYEAFMRGDNTQNKSGSGLGLRITKRILEYHNADISYIAKSENENLFRLTF
ncbi:Signal transduction histidine kinase [Soonwooa buanensis]|uniref:histidine kinase n=1 Tax=Soonwooa buanensis TaxID=619805 RepID=A0A1T5FHB0_9FLAO|nr:ATP-binding protein [Soonwooa buanensis]SKB95496.1 Signal transduction histidine kinase [Soonwooa buanensis]